MTTPSCETRRAAAAVPSTTAGSFLEAPAARRHRHHRPAHHRKARHPDRPLQAPAADRRRRHGRRLHGRAEGAGSSGKVALKIIKPGMDTRQVIARFEAERQALAMMDHPNIAKVLDAGATEVGPTVLRDGVGQRRCRSPSTATNSI